MARRRTPPTRRERVHDLLDSALGRVLTRVTIGAIVFLLAGIVMRQARAYTYRLEDFRVHEDQVAFVELPAWVDGRMQWALQPTMFPDFSVSIYDPGAEAAIRAHVERHPLVRRVDQVRVLYPNRAEVTPALRVPVARVRVWRDARTTRRGQTGRWYLISDDGCLLPEKVYRSYLARLPYELPVLRGITEPAPLDAGEVWEDGSGRVAEGLAAAQLAARIFRDSNGMVCVTRVDVSRFPAPPGARVDGEVQLVISCPPPSSGAARVERTVQWGRTERARDDVAREDDYRTKMERLKKVLTSRSPPRVIDVRWDSSLSQGGRTSR